MVDVPVPMAAATPVLLTNIAGEELLQEPPGVGSEKEVTPPVQIADGPAIGAGEGTAITVIIYVGDPDPVVYEITDDPAVIPVTIPSEDTLATDGVLLNQAPPVAVSVKVIDPPTHTIVGPLMAAPGPSG